jgi:hypothetical protein
VFVAIKKLKSEQRYQHPDTAALQARLEAARTTGKIQ